MQQPLFLKLVRRWATIAVVFFFWIAVFPVERVAADRIYDAGDLVSAAQMVDGIIPPDPDFADLTGDGEVTEADLALMLRLVHGQNQPERLFEAAIGTGGGSVGDDQTIKFIVPDEAFDQTMTLAIDRMPPDETPLPGVDNGPLYQVNGVPDDVEASLTVRTPVPDTFDSHDVFLEVGELTFGTRGFGWHYYYVDAELIDGFLVWEMPPIRALDEWVPSPAGEVTVDTPVRSPAAETAESEQEPGFAWRFRAVGGGQYWSREEAQLVSDRFRIRFPVSHIRPSESERSGAEYILAGLNDAFDILTSDPANFNIARSLPIDVYLKDLGESDGNMVSSRLTTNWDYIELHINSLQDLPRARVTAGHELFHVVQGLYGSTRAHLWLDEATATWFETIISEDSQYIPETFSSRPREGLRGAHVEPVLRRQLALWPGNWFTWETGRAQERGYSLSSFIEYLSRQPDWDLGRLRELYEQVESGSHPVAALSAITQGDFQETWIDYTQRLLLMQTLPFDPKQIIGKLSVDLETAFQGGEGTWGIRVTPPISSAQIFGRMFEHDIHVQQMGMRSLRKEFRVRDQLGELPDMIRFIGEAECKNSDDLPNLRLMPLVFAGQNTPQTLPLLAQEWIEERSTHRIEVAFPRQDEFMYMLAVFNDDVSEPYDSLAPITLRSYIGAFQLGGYAVALPYGNLAGCHVKKAVIEGDLGEVNLEVVEHSILQGMRILKVRLPHEHVDSLRIKIDAALEPPLTRTHYDPGIMWYNDIVIGGTVTATVSTEQGWRVDAFHLEENNVGPLISVEEARNTGIELPAPGPDEIAAYNLLYYFSAGLVASFDTDGYPFDVPDAGWSTDQWFISPLRIEIHGSLVNSGQSEETE